MNPNLIEDQISIPAGITPNVIVLNPALRRYLDNEYDMEGTFSAVQGAAGLIIDVSYGSKNVIDESPLRVSATIDESLDTINDAFYPKAGSQNVIRVNNTTAGAITLNYKMMLQPLDPRLGQQRQPDLLIMGVNQSIPSGAAGADVQVLDGRRYEEPTVESIMNAFMTASAAGLTRRLEVESSTLVPDSPINPSNRFPRVPWDLSLAGIEVLRNQKILLPVTNNTGGALTLQALIQLKELSVY